MYPDVTQMIDFYHSPLGSHCQAVMAERVLQCWPDIGGQRVGGFGYCVPQLGGMQSVADVTACIMPAPMGVVAWPDGAANKAALAEEDALPLPDESIDRMVLSHALEHVDSPRHFLREIWRVTAAEGRVILFVPNRLSLWALSDRTPFGHGRPFSRGQLTTLFRDSLFEVTSLSGVFYGPPGRGSISVGLSTALEPWGRKLWQHMPGVWMVEARKRVSAPLSGGKTIRRRAYAAAGLSPSVQSSSSSSS
jgi:SAM-dependent methyltransferase